MDFFTETEQADKNYTIDLNQKEARLVITVDLSKKEYPRTSDGKGKKLSVASSHGWDRVPNSPLSISMNVTADLPK